MRGGRTGGVDDDYFQVDSIGVSQDARDTPPDRVQVLLGLHRDDD